MFSRISVLYVGGFELPDKNAAAHRVLNNAKALRELGFNVFFYGIEKQGSSFNGQCKVAQSFPCWATPYPKNIFEWFKYQIRISQIANLVCKHNINVIIAYNMHALQLSKILAFGRKNNIKVIADITEWYNSKFTLNPVGFLRFLDTWLVMRVLHKKVDGQILISRYLDDFYHSDVVNRVVIPPLIDLNDTKWSNNNLGSDLSFFTDVVNFIYSGSLGRSNGKDNLFDIISCFASLNSNLRFKFKILGVSKDEYIKNFPNVECMIDKLGGKIEFLGRVTHQESILELNKADFHIFIRNRTRSNMAGFPTKFVESITCGIGIITNDFSNIKEFKPLDHKSIIIDTLNRENIENAIKTVLSYDINTIRNNRKFNDTFYYRKYLNEFKYFFDNLLH